MRTVQNIPYVTSMDEDTEKARKWRLYAISGLSFRCLSHPIKKAGNRNRTGDLRTTNATHYRLCYASIPFPLENFYTLSWRPSSVNHEFTFLSKKLCDHFFAHKGTAQMYGHGAFLRTQGFPCAILAEADRRGIIPRRTSPWSSPSASSRRSRARRRLRPDTAACWCR